MGWWSRFFGRQQPAIEVPRRIARGNPYPDRVRWIDGRWETPAMWCETAMRMLATDPKINGYASALRHSILSARWVVEAGSSDLEAQENAEIIREALGVTGHPCRLASGSLEHEIAKIIDFALLGRYVVEEIWSVGDDGREWLYGLGDIDQRSLIQDVRDTTTGTLTGIIQQPIGGGGQVVLPSTKIQIYSYRAVGDETLGIGLLRPCHSWWQLKCSLIDSLEAGARRWAIPTPQITFDRELLRSLYTDTEIRAFTESIGEWANGYIAGETGFVQAPAGINLTLFGGTFDPQRMIAAIQTCDQEIASAFGEGWQELGIGDVGSRSVGEIQWNAYKQSIANYLDAIAAVWNGPDRPGGGTIYRMLRHNKYGDDEIAPELLPRLAHKGVTVDAFADMIGVMPQLVAANLLTPTDDLERRIRREIGAELHSVSRPQRVETADGQPVSIDPRASQGGRPKESSV